MYLNLKLQLFKLGIHQNRLARELGIDETGLSKIINGYREPSETQRKQLADFLRVEEKWLFEKYDGPQRDHEPILNVLAEPGGKEGLS
jgi:transcriptional regulator with XRE-family HTH domain